MKAVVTLLESRCWFYENNLQNGVSDHLTSHSQGQMH